MPDSETKKLDSKILEFIHRYASSRTPEEEFDALALEIFDYQFRRNVLYRRFCLIQGKRSGSVRNWKEIPPMPATGFKELVLTTFPKERAVGIFKTSGTTRTAEGRGVHFFDSLRLYEAAIVPPFKRFLLPDARTASLFFMISPPREAPDSSLSFMMGVVSRCFAARAGRFYVKKSRPRFRELAADLRRLRSRAVLLATASALDGFLGYLKTKKIRLKLPSGSRLMETGGFKGRVRPVSRASLYAECRKYLGIREDHCVSEYGMTELSSQFYAVGPRGIFEGPAWTRTVVVDPSTGLETAPGRPGILLHVDLANRGSVAAVQTEDMGRAHREGGFSLLGRAAGTERRGCSLRYEEFIRQ